MNEDLQSNLGEDWIKLDDAREHLVISLGDMHRSMYARAQTLNLKELWALKLMPEVISPVNFKINGDDDSDNEDEYNYKYIYNLPAAKLLRTFRLTCSVQSCFLNACRANPDTLRTHLLST